MMAEVKVKPWVIDGLHESCDTEASEKSLTSSTVCGMMWIHSPEKSAVAHPLHFTLRKWPADCQSFFCVTTWHRSAGGPSQSNLYTQVNHQHCRCMSVCSFVAVTRWLVSVMSLGAACKSSLINVSELQGVWSFFEARSALLPKQLMNGKKPHRYFLSYTAASSVSCFTVFTFIHEFISVKRKLAASQVLHLKGGPAGHTGVALAFLISHADKRKFGALTVFILCLHEQWAPPAVYFIYSEVHTEVFVK